MVAKVGLDGGRSREGFTVGSPDVKMPRENRNQDVESNLQAQQGFTQT